MIDRLTIFTAEAADMLRDALGDDMCEMIRQVAFGYAELWRIDDTSYIVTRLETYADHTELCVVAFAGKNLREVTRMIVDHARAKGIDRVRFHSKESIYRMVRSFGFRHTHSVYELRLEGKYHG